MTIGEKWALNESLLQAYRGIFIMSQAFLIAVGVLLIDVNKPVWLILIVSSLAAIMIWYMWVPVVYSRSKIVDYYKFQTDESIRTTVEKVTEQEYVRNKEKRNKINNEIGKSNFRLTRIKVDIALPIMYTIIWFTLITARFTA